MTPVLISVLLFFILLVLGFLVFRMLRDAPSSDELVRLQTREQEFLGIAERLEQREREAAGLALANARLEAELAAERRAAADRNALLDDAGTQLKFVFENLANRIFEERGQAFSEQSRERMTALLQPLREQLALFRTRVDEVHRNDTELSARLLEQVRQLQELTGRVSGEANNLARAIKGDSKKQGDWGELIVERLFEASGLERGREYEAQPSGRNDEGRLVRPDFMVYLPGEKAVIVDAKVSLTAYERYCSEEDEHRRAEALKEHLRSVRSHVEELREKRYSGIGGNRTLDFVIMCIPLEPAFQEALQADRELLYDLAGTQVVMTGPATLMITLKLIAQIWRRENENRNAETIADRAGKIYDQVVLVADAMTDARKRLSGVSDALDLALKRLSEGRGNLAGRAEEIRKLGAKVSRQLPPDLAGMGESGGDPDHAE
jgi:DNA recombination protein RmuC